MKLKLYILKSVMGSLTLALVKMMNLLKGKVFDQNMGQDSEKIELSGTSIDEIHNHPSSRAKRWTYEGSGWTTFSILQHQVFIS